MKMADLQVEAHAACQRVRQPHIDRLIALGVPGAAIATLGEREIPFGIGTVERMADGLYQPGEGSLHVISPVYEGGEIIDLVAWRSNAPGNWAWRTGLGWALGCYMLSPRWDDDPVIIHATPLDWLRAGGTGMCILDWEAPEIEQMRALAVIEADEWIASRITRTLNKPRRLPKILTRKEVRCAA